MFEKHWERETEKSPRQWQPPKMRERSALHCNENNTLGRNLWWGAGGKISTCETATANADLTFAQLHNEVNPLSKVA